MKFSAFRVRQLGLLVSIAVSPVRAYVFRSGIDVKRERRRKKRRKIKNEEKETGDFIVPPEEFYI